jgi:hypothetical protein
MNKGTLTLFLVGHRLEPKQSECPFVPPFVPLSLFTVASLLPRLTLQA